MSLEEWDKSATAASCLLKMVRPCSLRCGLRPTIFSSSGLIISDINKFMLQYINSIDMSLPVLVINLRFIDNLIQLLKAEVYFFASVDHFDKALQRVVLFDRTFIPRNNERQRIFYDLCDLALANRVRLDGLCDSCFKISLDFLQINRKLLNFLHIIPIDQSFSVELRLSQLFSQFLHGC